MGMYVLYSVNLYVTKTSVYYWNMSVRLQSQNDRWIQSYFEKHIKFYYIRAHSSLLTDEQIQVLEHDLSCLINTNFRNLLTYRSICVLLRK